MDRVGIGQDSHQFAKNKNKPLVLGGVKVAGERGLEGNSDSDVILHSLCNALSSACGGDSLSTWSDEMLKNGISDSQQYVEQIFLKLKGKKYKVGNVAICVEAKRPYFELATINKMKENIARLLEIEIGQVGITFTSGEGLTPFGKGLGIQVFCQVILSNA